jgi:hypothetical protein
VAHPSDSAAARAAGAPAPVYVGLRGL